ncbi:hypothetical protein HanRHA438_Chr01g0022521 [Helianthus annuus]|nr:hypothetical protein HanRHA438_Chr01g0022521 [Helianthus annuus]
MKKKLDTCFSAVSFSFIINFLLCCVSECCLLARRSYANRSSKISDERLQMMRVSSKRLKFRRINGSISLKRLVLARDRRRSCLRS